MSPPRDEWLARMFPGSRRAEEFDDTHGTNYSGRDLNRDRDETARDVAERKDADWRKRR